MYFYCELCFIVSMHFEFKFHIVDINTEVDEGLLTILKLLYSFFFLVFANYLTVNA